MKIVRGRVNFVSGRGEVRIKINFNYARFHRDGSRCILKME